MPGDLPFSSQALRNRAAESYLASENHALDMRAYGHNHILLVSLPAASIYPLPQAKSVQRPNPIHLLRRNFAFPKMQITMKFLPKPESSQGPLAPIILHTQRERAGEHSCIHQHRLL